MTVGSVVLREIIRELADEEPFTRELAAENVSDWSRSFHPREVRLLVPLLASLAAFEEEPTVRESQLHAIFELSVMPGYVPADVQPVFSLDKANLGPSEREYINCLRKDQGFSV